MRATCDAATRVSGDITSWSSCWLRRGEPTVPIATFGAPLAADPKPPSLRPPSRSGTRSSPTFDSCAPTMVLTTLAADLPASCRVSLMSSFATLFSCSFATFFTAPAVAEATPLAFLATALPADCSASPTSRSAL
jgi:hypothetical protein